MTFTIIFLALVGLTFSLLQPNKLSQEENYCPVFNAEPLGDCEQFPDTFLDFPAERAPSLWVDTNILDQAFDALNTLQREYFDSDYGTWPSTIDWTGAVVGTIISGMLRTLTDSFQEAAVGGAGDWKSKENLISSFYAQVVGYFFGQNVLAIRGQVSSGSLSRFRVHTNLFAPHRHTTTSFGWFWDGLKLSTL